MVRGAGDTVLYRTEEEKEIGLYGNHARLKVIHHHGP